MDFNQLFPGIRIKYHKLFERAGIFHLLQITKIIEAMLAKWNRKFFAVSCLLKLSPFGLLHIKKGQLWSMAKSKCKMEFHPYAVFLTPAERHAKLEFRAL